MRGLSTAVWTRPLRASSSNKLPFQPCASCLYIRYFSFSRTQSSQKRSRELPASPARTRFAPSPTGFLHLGSLRTALFNYLLAKKTGGQFLLRVEDTDRKRTVDSAEQRLYEDLQWANLHWDEGPLVGGPYGPYRQSERIELYQKHAHDLVESGHAYRCFCTAERLDDLARRRKELGLPTDYDRLCASIPKDESDERSSKGESHVVRLRAPELYPAFNDLVYGKVGKGKGANVGVTYKHGEIAYEDPVLLKSDGRPTYHLANVVDDHSMQITHVVRATEWMSSTPKHLALYDAFGWEPPLYAHVGLLLDESGQKLSKRNFGTDVEYYRNMGVLPETVINFLALLGWSHTQKSDVMDLNDLIDQFEPKFTKGNTTVTLDKLWYLQKAHAARAVKEPSKSASLQLLQDKFYDFAREQEKSDQALNGGSLRSVTDELVIVDAKNYSTPANFHHRNIYFFKQPAWNAYENNLEEIASTDELVEATDRFVTDLADQEWSHDTLNAQIKKQSLVEDTTLDEMSVKEKEKKWKKAFCDYLRWALVNGCQGPTLAQTMEILGRSVSISRLEDCKKISKHG